MACLRMVAQDFAEKELDGIEISPEVMDILEDIAMQMLSSETQLLHSKIAELQDENVNLRSNQLKQCLICQDNIAEYMWSSCCNNQTVRVGHLTACKSCADTIANGPVHFRCCPLCRASDSGFWLRVDARE